MFKLKITFISFFIFCFFSGCHGDDEVENEDFYEIDISKLDSKYPVKFGIKLTGNNATRYDHLKDDFGPVLNLAFWHGIWEVSAAAPAPREATDDSMERWVDSIYYNLRYYMPEFKRVSDSMKDNKIDLIIAALTVPNSYFMTPNERTKWLEYKLAISEGREPEMMKDSDFTKEYMEMKKKNENEFDRYNQLTPEFIPDIAKFYVFSLLHLDKENFTMPFIELTYEPDSKDIMYVDPVDYATLLKLIKYEVKEKGIEFNKFKFVGPGASSAAGAKPYIEALAKNREGYDMLHSWSIHVWDEGNSIEEIEQQILHFQRIVNVTIPPSWPKKPIKVTEFGYKPSSRLANKDDDLEYGDNLQNCYKGLHSPYRYKLDQLRNSMSQSPEIAVRLLANLILQYSHGFRHSVYGYAHDHFWSKDCKGLFDRIDRPKQLFVPLSTFLQHIDEKTKVLKKQWTNKEDCVIAAFKTQTSMLFVMANLGEKSCSRSFSIKGANIPKFKRATTHSYNNGTVSLNADHPSKALVTSMTLDCDVYTEENENGVIEFDLVLGTKASVVAVFDFTKVEGEEVINEDDVLHTISLEDEATEESTSSDPVEVEADNPDSQVEYEAEVIDEEVQVHAEL